MKLSEWIFGPQLIGLMFSLAGIVMIVFPPNKINGLEVYLTSSVTKNDQILEEIRRWLPRYMLKYSLIVIIAGIAITAVLKLIVSSAQLRQMLALMFLIMSTVLTMPIIMAKIGQHLEKKFNNKDEIR